MRITADTNVLVRAVTEDHVLQSKAAQAALKAAELVAIPIPSLCELVWVLSQGYKIPPRDIAEAIRRLTNSANVVVNRPAAEAGLALLEAGGDFADCLLVCARHDHLGGLRGLDRDARGRLDHDRV